MAFRYASWIRIGLKKALQEQLLELVYNRTLKVCRNDDARQEALLKVWHLIHDKNMFDEPYLCKVMVNAYLYEIKHEHNKWTKRRLPLFEIAAEQNEDRIEFGEIEKLLISRLRKLHNKRILTMFLIYKQMNVDKKYMASMLGTSMHRASKYRAILKREFRNALDYPFSH